MLALKPHLPAVIGHLLALALLAPVSAHAAWREARTKHFIIYSEASEKDIRRHAERLEALHWLMLAANGVADEPDPYPVRVYFVSPDNVKRLYGGKNPNVAGFYNARPEGPIAVTPRATGDDFANVVLFHEYGHHFMLQYFPAAYPAWYVEGWAELVSTASFETKGKVSYGKAASHRQYDLELGRNIPIRDLLTKNYRDIGDAFRERFYGQSWLLAHYLTFSDERKGQLRAYLGAINRGASFEDAAAAFGDLDQLHRDLGRYLGARNFRYRQPELPAGLGQDVAIRTLEGVEAALFDEALEFTRPMNEADAKAFLARLRREAAAWPNDPFALQLLAEVEFDAKDFEAAARTAEKLLAAAPTSPRALTLKGRVDMEKADALEGAARGPAFVAARTLIVRARTLAPDDPLPHIAYFTSFAREGKRPPGQAITGLRTALAIVPQDSGLRLTLGSWLIADDKSAEAIRVLRPLAFDPHGSGASKAAREMLAKAMGGPAETPAASE